MDEWGELVFVGVDRFAERLRVVGFEVATIADVYLYAPKVFASESARAIGCEVNHVASRGHYRVALPMTRVGRFAKIDRIGPLVAFANRIPYITRTNILTIRTLNKEHIATIGRE